MGGKGGSKPENISANDNAWDQYNANQAQSQGAMSGIAGLASTALPYFFGLP